MPSSPQRKTYTEACLDPSLWPEPFLLSPEELQALKDAGQFDPDIHREDGTIVGDDPASQQAMRDDILKYLNQLHPALQNIVDAELAKGNFVYGAGIDYPEPGSIQVTLSRYFDDDYDSEETPFSYLNDPRYWHADYQTIEKPVHLLIC